MSAILHDDDFVVVLLHIRQRFGEDAGDVERRYGHNEKPRVSPALSSRRAGSAIGIFAKFPPFPRAGEGRAGQFLTINAPAPPPSRPRPLPSGQANPASLA